MEPREFERRFLAEVLIELLANPTREPAPSADDFVLRKEIVLFRSIHLDGEHPDTRITVLFSFPAWPEKVYGFRQRLWDGIDAWDDGVGRPIRNNPEKAGMMFCVSFEENLETEHLPGSRTVPPTGEPIWIRGSFG